MRDWDVGKMNEWLAGQAAADPALGTIVQRTQGLPPSDLLRLVDAFCTAQPGLLRDEEDAADESDRNKNATPGAGSSTASVLGATSV